jgi:hypothetical protein
MTERNDVKLDAKREPAWRVVLSALRDALVETRVLYAFLAVVGLGYFLVGYSRVETFPPTPEPVTAVEGTIHNARLGQVDVVGTLNDDEGNPMPRPPSRTVGDAPSFNGSDHRLERDSCCPGE